MMDLLKKMILSMTVLMLLCLLLVTDASAQTPLEIRKADKLFSGFWVNRKTKRHLLMGVEKEGYVLINDWAGEFQDRGSADAYNAYIKGEKLIMPPDSEHHAPYAEMQIINGKLVYSTKFKDVKGKLTITKELFVRELR